MGIEAAIAAAIVSAGASAATAALIASVVVNTVVSVGLGLLSSVLTKTPNLSGSFSAKAQGVTQNIKQAITVRRTVYGEARVGGALTKIETTNDDEFIHLILTIADHECEDIGEIWFNDISIPPDYIDGSGNVIDGEFSGFARIKKHLGAVGQVADSDLVTETTATSNFIGTGVTYLYIRLKFDRDIYPTSIPSITAFVKGKKIFDVRDNGTRWTTNGALFSYDYLTEPLDSLTPGAGVDSADIDTAFMTASANVSDEMVTTNPIVETLSSVDASTDIMTLSASNDTLIYQTGDRVQLTTTGVLPAGLSLATNYYVIPFQRKTTLRIRLASTLANALSATAVDFTDSGTGMHTITKNAEPRYSGGGVIETNTTVGDNLRDILSTIGGDSIYIGGKWFVKAASYHTPVFTFSEDDLTSSITIQTGVSMRDRFNFIKGVYVSPLNDGEPADYPPVTNATYVSDDGATLPIDYDLPMTQRPHTAMRLAKIKLERHRQEIFFEASFNLKAMQVQPGDVVYINNDRMGWVNKTFEVVKWSLANDNQNGSPLFYVKMSLQETVSTAYDWSTGEETPVDPAPNTNLPNPLSVDPPTGLSVTPVEIPTAFGDLTYEFVVAWTAPADIFVVNGGYYNVEFKKSVDTVWRRSFRAEDSDTDITVKQVQPGVNYDVRIQSVNNLGVRSSYQSLFGFTVDSPSGATIQIDYGLVTGAVVDIFDYGLITAAVDATNDYGSIN